MIIVSSFVNIFSIECVAQNRPPFFETPTPENDSTNNPLDLSWSIPINDTEGDLFSWTIQCSNGQINNGTSDTNGTKSLALSGLTYATIYKVWVNATDPTGSGLYTRNWCLFTTKGNQPPIFRSPNPINGSINNPLSFNWNIPINDSDGDMFSWNIQCSNGQVNSTTGAANGIKSLSVSGLAYSTTYTVWVNATDPTPTGSGLWTRRWYTFTTEVNNTPMFGTPSPANGSTGNLLSLNWSIPINDPESDLFSWTIQCNNGQTNSSTGEETNGIKSLLLSGLWYTRTYTVWVNATDPTGSDLYTRRWYTFTTKINNTPVFGTPSPRNGSTGNLLSLNWNIPINDPEGDLFSWTIKCSLGQVNSTTGASNGIKSLSVSGLAYSMTYTVWVNATDPTGSGLWTRRWYRFTTAVYNPPGGTPSTENQKPVADLSVGEPYQGIVKTEITFNGSKSYDPDGTITNWFWVFGDNLDGTGKTVQHTYSKAGTYTVTLTVTDNEGATNTNTTTCIITEITKQLNRPPTKPTISGTITGPTNTEYEYTVVSIDPDNDLIKYTFNWSESGSQSSQFLPSGTKFTANHSWTIPGQYLLTVTVTDNQTGSSSYLKINIHAGNKEPQKTPGFEFILLLLAITLLLIWKRKRRENN